MDSVGNEDIGKLVSEIRSLKKELQGLVEINSRLTKEIINIKSNKPITTDVAEKTNSLVVHIDTECVKIYGNTYQHRNIFNSLGGSWDGNNKHWVLKHEHKDTLLEKLGTESVEFEIRE